MTPLKHSNIQKILSDMVEISDFPWAGAEFTQKAEPSLRTDFAIPINTSGPTTQELRNLLHKHTKTSHA